MADIAHTTSRRSMLSALVIAPLLAAGPVSAGTAIHTEISRSSQSPWAAAYAEFRRLDDLETEFDIRHVSPAHDAFYADLQNLPHAEVTYIDALGQPKTWSTANENDPYYARRDQHLVSDHRPQMEARDRFLAAVRARETEIARLREYHRIDALDEQAKALTDRYSTALDAAMATTPANLTEMVEKMTLADQRFRIEREDVRATLIADLRQLAG